MTWSRRALIVSAIFYLFSGLTFFILPIYAAANFPWNVSEFVAMTIGGWTLGVAFMAREALRNWSLARVFPTLLAVWSFSILEGLVALAFVNSLRTDHWLTWPYLLAIAFGAASAALGAPNLWRQRRELLNPVIDDPRAVAMPSWIRATYAVFVVVVGLLALATLLIVPTGGTVFPEPLGAFTTRAFSAFFAALAIGALPLVFSRDPEPAAHYARAGIYPIVLILVAAFSYLVLFDFGARPGGLIYIGAYVLTLFVAVWIVAWHRRETADPDFTPRY